MAATYIDPEPTAGTESLEYNWHWLLLSIPWVAGDEAIRHPTFPLPVAKLATQTDSVYEHVISLTALWNIFERLLPYCFLRLSEVMSSINLFVLVRGPSSGKRLL